MSIDLNKLAKACEAFEKFSGVTVWAATEENPFKLPDDQPPADLVKKVEEASESLVFNKDEIESLKHFNPSLPDSFWQKFIDMCGRLGCKPKELALMLKRESNFKPEAVAPVVDSKTHKVIKDKNGKIIPQAKGLNQFIHATAVGKMVGMPEDVWKRYETLSAEEQLPYLEKFFSALNIKGLDAHQMHLKNFGGHNNPDKSMYASKEWMDKHPEMFGHLTEKQKAQQDYQFSQNTALDRNKDGRITPDEVA